MIYIIAEILILTMFLLSGLFKLLRPEKESIRLKTKLSGIELNDTHYITLVLLAGIWELLSVISIAYGEYNNDYKWGMYGSISLILFTMLVSLIFFFPPDTPMKYYPFMSNVNTVGGLLLLCKRFMN